MPCNCADSDDHGQFCNRDQELQFPVCEFCGQGEPINYSQEMLACESCVREGDPEAFGE